MTKIEQQDLKDRLNLIENMIAEGRRTTESWGWTFVLWGVAYYIAIAWSTYGYGWSFWGHAYIAWPVTMISASILTMVLAGRKRSRQAATTIGRAMMAIWLSMGISMFLLLFSLGMSGRYEQQMIVAIIGAMLGSTNAASSIILKWKMQFACAVVWWAAASASCFGTVNQSAIAFLVAIFFCQIVFGIYGMMAEARQRKQGASHA